MGNTVKWFTSKLLLPLALGFVFFPGQDVYACCGCSGGDCSAGSNQVQQYHQEITNHTNQEFDDDLKAFEDWMEDEFFQKHIVPALRQFATQMSAVAMQHAQIMGTFLDAKTQMETQRLFQELTAEAHRDYIPSDDFCWFGTNTRTLAASQNKGRFNSYALSKMAIDRQLGKIGSIASQGVEQDLKMRWNNFIKKYCDSNDNNANIIAYSNTGLALACDHDGSGPGDDIGAEDLYRVNRDVDYTRFVDLPRTLDVNFSDGNADSKDEIDLVAMSRNLYGHKVLPRGLGAMVKNAAAQNLYLALRSVVARRSVAQDTFNTIVGMKAAGTVPEFVDRVLGGVSPAVGHTTQYLAAILRDLYPYDPSLAGCLGNGKKLCDADIYEIMGADPSYYAQLEIMGKKMYQNPNFYVKLYDTPANVERKSVAMRAIELMIDREMYLSQLRREMTVSVLLASKLRAEERRVNRALVKAGAISE